MYLRQDMARQKEKSERKKYNSEKEKDKSLEIIARGLNDYAF